MKPVKKDNPSTHTQLKSDFWTRASYQKKSSLCDLVKYTPKQKPPFYKDLFGCFSISLLFAGFTVVRLVDIIFLHHVCIYMSHLLFMSSSLELNTDFVFHLISSNTLHLSFGILMHTASFTWYFQIHCIFHLISSYTLHLPFDIYIFVKYWFILL